MHKHAIMVLIIDVLEKTIYTIEKDYLQLGKDFLWLWGNFCRIASFFDQMMHF